MLRARGIESFDVRLRAGLGWAELRAHSPIQLDADLRQVDWPSGSEFLFLACVFVVLVLVLFGAGAPVRVVTALVPAGSAPTR